MTERTDLPVPHSELARQAVESYEHGDFAATRALARSILRRSGEFADDAELARILLKRTTPDRVVVFIGVTVLLTVIAVFLWAVHVSH